MEYRNKKVAVLGLGIEGTDAVAYLLKKEAEVTLFDQKEENQLDFGNIDKTKIKIFSGKDYLIGGLNSFDIVVRSPGVYRFIPEIIEAEKNGAVITSAIKMFFDECNGKIIGVTGTKGKGTTSSLIYEILKHDKRDVYLAGNIGKPFLELLPKLTDKSWIVMEMSSFQLIDMETSPHIAVVLNITLDHMDWHKDSEEYVKAKENIVKFQKSVDFALLNEEYNTSKTFAGGTKAKVIFFSKAKLEDVYKENLLLRGEHNLENIAAAVETAKCIGIDGKTILNTVRNFKGLEHRLELVDDVDGIKFYNDSFATGPQPTIAAINSFTEPETVILGGSDKGLDYSELTDLIKRTPNLKNIILIGTTGAIIKKEIGSGEHHFKIYDMGFSTMEEIVKKAYEISEKGSVVILSPASASFDMFKNYKDRGNQFKNAVKLLLQEKR